MKAFEERYVFNDKLSRKYGMVLMCVWSIELNWVAKYGKMEQKHNFLAFSGDMYKYTMNMYWYMLGSCHFGPTCTGTGQGCTGTCDALFPVSISFCILAITCSLLIGFE